MTIDPTHLAAILRGAGVPVIEVPGWRGRGHGVLRPRGQLVHHTADNAGLKAVFSPSGDVRPDVPQPRANLWYPRNEAAVYLVASGVAYHAGRNSAVALNEVCTGRVSIHTPDAAERHLADDTDQGNDYLIGHEVENLGTGQEYPAQQLDLLIRSLAAICKAAAWSPGHIAHHRQVTRRKTDMSYRGDLWSVVERVLTQPKGDDDMDQATFSRLFAGALDEYGLVKADQHGKGRIWRTYRRIVEEGLKDQVAMTSWYPIRNAQGTVFLVVPFGRGLCRVGMRNPEELSWYGYSPSQARLVPPDSDIWTLPLKSFGEIGDAARQP